MSQAWQNYRWAQALLNTLTLVGCRHFFIAPGSRNAPLSMAALRMADANADVHCHRHFDERGLSFLALGAAKASQKPVVVITTSGSAVANLLPAVVEASQLDIPLFLITADRPPELINCGANQAIVQPGLFSHFVRLFDELPLPLNASDATNRLSQSADRWLAKLSTTPGPIHLNVPLREPLYADTQQPDDSYPVLPPVSINHANIPVSESLPAVTLTAPIIIVAGQLNSHEANTVLAIAEHHDWPILADIGSQLRLRNHPNIVSATHFITQTSSLAGVNTVVQFGARLVSKPVNQWLEHFDGAYYLLSNSPQKLDPSGKARQICVDYPDWANQLIKNGDNPKQFSADLRLKGATILKRVEQCVRSAFSEYSVAQILSEVVPNEHYLMLGNSLSIRVFDQVAITRSSAPIIFCSRGASGIDGLIATSVGLTLANKQPVTAVLGDVSMLYDLNSLALLRQIQQTFILVVLNNDGGQIFSMLPAADQHDVYERAFTQPHGLGFADFCRGFDIRHYSADNAASLTEHYREACVANEACVIEVTLPATAFKDHHALLQRCWHD